MQELLDKVNRTVNRDYYYVRDEDQYRRADFWPAMKDTIAGDCEDFALAKREILRQEIPASRLQLAVCSTDEKELHAVLIVRDGDAEWVLDNRYPMPLKKYQLPAYRWIKQQDDQGRWRDMEGSATTPPPGWVDYCERENDGPDSTTA